MPKSHPVERTCLCCEVVFEGRANAARCPECIAAGRKVPSRKQRERKEKRKQHAVEQAFEAAGGSGVEFREQKVEFDAVANQRRKRKEHLDGQIAWLNQQSRKPKGYPPMLKATPETSLGQLWLSLCHADGQVNCLTRETVVPVADRERLLMAHFRLRLTGYSADAMAKVCPIALINADAETLTDALDGLLKVYPEPLTHEQKRQHLQAVLGLSS